MELLTRRWHGAQRRTNRRTSAQTDPILIFQALATSLLASENRKREREFEDEKIVKFQVIKDIVSHDTVWDQSEKREALKALSGNEKLFHEVQKSCELSLELEVTKNKLFIISIELKWVS